MPQMHFYVPETIAKQLRSRARAAGLSVSRYVSTIVRRQLAQGWPEGYFKDVVGAWQGRPLRRPAQGNYDTRDAL